MMTGPDRRVRSCGQAGVDDRHVYGDWAVSWGNLHDQYMLTDGTTFNVRQPLHRDDRQRGAV